MFSVPSSATTEYHDASEVDFETSVADGGAGADAAGAGAGAGAAGVDATAPVDPHHRFYNMSLDEFRTNIVPTLTKADVVIALAIGEVCVCVCCVCLCLIIAIGLTVCAWCGVKVWEGGCAGGGRVGGASLLDAGGCDFERDVTDTMVAPRCRDEGCNTVARATGECLRRVGIETSSECCNNGGSCPERFEHTPHGARVPLSRRALTHPVASQERCTKTG